MNTEAGTGSFPTMGTSAAELKRTGSVERGRLRPRGIGGKGGSDIPGTGDKKNRGATYGKMGATLHPGATLYEQNAAEASDTQRHLLMMPSRSSWSGGFKAPAKYGRTLS
jgi:hypothetical protein